MAETMAANPAEPNVAGERRRRRRLWPLPMKCISPAQMALVNGLNVLAISESLKNIDQ
jgi:hypothetical protein